jgi:hypothetical protein
MRILTFELFADYFQFYLQDEDSNGINGDSWSNDACARKLAVEPDAIGVGTERNFNVPVVIELWPSEPPLDFAAWDHVVECSFAVPTGKIVVAGCTDELAESRRIDIDPGIYRARVSGGHLASAKSFDEGDDVYRVQLWRAPAGPIDVLKQDETAPQTRQPQH